MEIHVTHSTESETALAVEDALTQMREKLGGKTPQLGFFFVTHHHEDHFPTLAGTLQNGLNCDVMLGCTTETIVANNAEYENSPGLALWMMVDPSATFEPFRLTFERDLENDTIQCHGCEFEPQPATHGAVLLLCEPYSSSPYVALPQLAEQLHQFPVFGGVASGGLGPGESVLFLDGELIDHGAVGVVYRGEHRVRPIVSQGCRPIGHTFVVTRAEKNIVYELGGRASMAQFREMFEDLKDEDKELVRRGPHFGVATNEYKSEFCRGDFLVSNVLGSDPETGAIAVSQPVRPGRTVQFHVRDAITADEDLRLMIAQDCKQNSKPVAGALMFDCNGRGEQLFGMPHHDALMFQQAYGNIPLAGCFAQGEFGPLGERSYLHGFTASIALFEK
ncbi:MAG: FIST C-terminal domain-containing protein [Planctomycetaceae bacterium]|nr:FIST C-terminal domain-containing protein [Planctomycetaceae bacterium]